MIAEAAPDARGDSPFISFWMGGYEGADHLNSLGRPLDMLHITGHLERMEEDHRAAAALGIRTVRESVGWRHAELAPRCFDFSRIQHTARSARGHGLQVVWTFMHYGTPTDLSLFDDELIPRFANFAGAVAGALAPMSDRPPVYNLINEIGFLAWAASATNLLHPYRGDPSGQGERTEASGYAVKQRLVKALLAGVTAVRKADPRARFLHVEPLVHVVAPKGRPELETLARQVHGYQWQVWDMIAGRADPDLGGSASALDLIGANFYHNGQWEVVTERRLHWHEQDVRRRPLSGLLGDAWQRYGRPLMVAETSHVGSGRAAWLNDVASEVEKARHAGVPVQGICLYPLIDRPDWDDADHWHHSGLWDIDPAIAPTCTARWLCTDYAAALARWQARLPEPRHQGVTMPHLIVFSHLRWNFVYQRPQQLMSRLSRHYTILFVEETTSIDGPARLDVLPQGPGLDVVVPRTPVHGPGFHDDQLPVLRPLLTEFLRQRGIDDYIVWFYTPMALPLISEMLPRLVVYDCMDELSAFKDAPRQLRQRETALLKTADLVLTGGPGLYERRKPLHPNVHCLPSAVDSSHFAPEHLRPDTSEALAVDSLLHEMPRPRLGFFGVIDERTDLALVKALADARPEWQIIMVGPVAKIDHRLLPDAPNLHWLGMQTYERLPYFLAAWDVCLMPFALNESTRFISPTKTLEYLAGGKPVVSTPVPDVIALYGDKVRIASDAAGFVAACEAALNESPSATASRVNATRKLVSESSWDRCADTIHQLIGETLARSRVMPAISAGVAVPPSRDIRTSEAPAIGAAVARQTRRVRHLIIGAGPTGLSAAYHLGNSEPPGETLLVEREQRVGGWCRSVQQDGFTFDHAGHIMFSNDPYVLELYERLLGDNVHWQNREAWIYSKNVYTRYPFQGSLYGLPPQVLKECIMGAIESRFGSLQAGGEAPRRDPPANFQEFIEQVWGAGISRHFATPYNEKLWAMPLNEMETSWLGGRVPLPDLEQMIEGALEPTPAPMGPNARFGYPLRGGFQALMDGFLPLLQCELALRTSVLHVSPSTRTVRLDDGRSIRFDSLVSTMPLPLLVAACEEEAPPEVRQAAQALRHVSLRCVNLGIGLGGRERLTDKHWIYYPEDSVFHRIFVQGNASPHCNPPGGFGLTCEITYNASKPLPCDGAALIERVIADCRRVGLVGQHDPVLTANQLDLPCAYVVYDHARAANVALIRDWFSGFSIVLAGRYSEWEYYNSDHAFLAGRNAAQQARASLQPLTVAQAG